MPNFTSNEIRYYVEDRHFYDLEHDIKGEFGLRWYGRPSHRDVMK